ncbi:MAG: AraC family transcriptional regulator [Eubacteriales bacterium]|nr:AraC family transcriptional regulator [Eubacteriales bacterium]
MHAWEAIQTSVDHIEEHLSEPIQTEALAQLAGLSQFYFQRLFKRLVKKPLQEYIKLRRLARAAEALRTEKKRILDIALDYGFASHGNFTRAFKDTYGITPEEYRKKQPLLNTCIKPEISMGYVLIDEGIPLIAGNIVLEIRRERLNTPEMYLGLTTDVSIAAQTPVGESTGIDIPGQLWTRYHDTKKLIEDYIVPDIELGMSYSADMEKGTFSYFAGGLAAALPQNLNRDFVRQELPAGEYIVCSIEAESFKELVTTALDQAGKYLFGTWLPKHKLTTQPFSAEKYIFSQEDTNRMEIWAAPITE